MRTARLVTLRGDTCSITLDSATTRKGVKVIGDTSKLTPGCLVYVDEIDGTPVVITSGKSSKNVTSNMQASSGAYETAQHPMSYHTDENEWHAGLEEPNLHDPKTHNLLTSHTVSGLSLHTVAKATGASAWAFASLAHDELVDIDADEHVPHSSVSIIAGSGVTGGGTIDSDVTINIGSGTLITVSENAISLSVGSAAGQAIVTGASPFTPSYSSTPTWAGLHTFNAGIDITGTIEFQTAGIIKSLSSGNITLYPAGDIILDPDGMDVLPNAGYELRLGSLSKKFLSLHCAELWVETLVAQDTIATIGGRILVGPTTQLVSDLNSVSTSINVKHNEMTIGDRVYMEAGGSVEFMAITAGPTGSAGSYFYTVTRNLDGTGANTWYAGDAVFNTGAAGDGFIDIYSVHGVKSSSQYGPTIVGNVRTGSTYNSWIEHWAVGNLNGLYGYGTDTYGIGLGRYSGADYITIDTANGIRFLDEYDVVQASLSTGAWTLGRVAVDFSNIQITSGSVKLRANTTSHLELHTSGALWAGDTSSTERMQWDLANGLSIFDASNNIVFNSSPSGVTWLSTLAISDDLGKSLFSLADGKLLLGPGCEITPTSWTTLRGQTATLSGAFHQVAGRWPETRALMVEGATTNLITNPSFETDETGWTLTDADASVTKTRTTDRAYSGQYSIKLINTDAGDDDRIAAAISGLDASTAYTVSAWLFIESLTAGAVSDRGIYAYDANDVGGTAKTATITSVTPLGSWVRLSVTVTMSASPGNLVVRLYSPQGTIYWDSVQVEKKICTTSYCDGSLGTGYAWSGTAHASTSTRAATEVNLDAQVGLLSENDTLSFSLWVQAPYDADGAWSQTAGNNYVLDAYGGSGRRIVVRYNDVSDRFEGYIYDAWYLTGTTQTFSAGDWIHVAFSLDFTNDVYRLYVNGVLDDTDTTAQASAALSEWNIGSRYTNIYHGGFAFGEFAIFDRVLTAEEIAAIYASGNPLADSGATTKPGIYVLDGMFSLKTSTAGIRTELTAPGLGVYEDDGLTGVGRILVGMVDTSSKILDESASDIGAFGYDAADTLQVAWYASGSNAGKIVAGAGEVVLDESGITIGYGAGAFNKVKWDFGDANKGFEINGFSPMGGTTGSVATFDANVSPGVVSTTIYTGQGGDYSYAQLFVDYMVLTGSDGIDLRISGGASIGSDSLDPEAGVLWIDEISSTPGSPNNGADVKVYMKSNKLIVMYNDGGTVRYKYLDLTGTGVTWVHTTTAP
jgi:hypothetical protein